MYYCQQNLADYFCADQTGFVEDTATDADMTVRTKGAYLSSHGCVSYCKASAAADYRTATVWRDAGETNCACDVRQDTELLKVARKTPGLNISPE